MGPLRIRVLSLESKLTPHARPVVDRRDGTFGKVPNLIFPPYLLVSDGYLVSLAAAFPEGCCCRPRLALHQAPSVPNNAYFLCCFEFESKGVLERLD